MTRFIRIKSCAPAQTPRKVGDSRFESWYSEDFDPKSKGTKQQMREAYEAGMNDRTNKAQTPPPRLTEVQREGLFAQATLAMDADINLSWRNAIATSIEDAVRKQAGLKWPSGLSF